MVCTVTGVLRSPDGVAMPDAHLSVRQGFIAPSADGASLPVIVNTTSDASGAVSFDLLPGRYTLFWRCGDDSYTAPMSIPDAAATALSDALGIGAGYVPKVGAIIPPGDPGQVVGYDAEGKPIAVRAPGPVVKPSRGEAQAYSETHPGVMVVVPTGPGEPGAMYLGGMLVWDMQSGPPPAGLTFGIETEDGNLLIAEDGDLLVGEA